MVKYIDNHQISDQGKDAAHQDHASGLYLQTSLTYEVVQFVRSRPFHQQAIKGGDFAQQLVTNQFQLQGIGAATLAPLDRLEPLANDALSLATPSQRNSRHQDHGDNKEGQDCQKIGHLPTPASSSSRLRLEHRPRQRITRSYQTLGKFGANTRRYELP